MLSGKKKQSSSTVLAPSSSQSAAIYLQKPHHHLPAASTSYFHTNGPTGTHSSLAAASQLPASTASPTGNANSSYKQHRSRYSSPLYSQSILDEPSKITPYITSPTRNSTIYTSNPVSRSASSKYYNSTLNHLNGSATNSSGSPNSSSSGSPNITSISYPSNGNSGSNGHLKKSSSLRHTNLRSPLNINAQQQPQTAPKVNSNFNSNYLIKKKILSSSPVHTNSAALDISSATTTTNGLGFSAANG